jgi:hypothetical protein
MIRGMKWFSSEVVVLVMVARICRNLCIITIYQDRTVQNNCRNLINPLLHLWQIWHIPLFWLWNSYLSIYFETACWDIYGTRSIVAVQVAYAICWESKELCCMTSKSGYTNSCICYSKHLISVFILFIRGKGHLWTIIKRKVYIFVHWNTYLLTYLLTYVRSW